MIARVDSIKSLGILADFAWEKDGKALSNFQKRNLIYGWNYSGKTTFSRIFSAVELARVDPDFSGASFQITDTSGRSFSSKNLEAINLNIRTFNVDFIRNNLKWDDSFLPIFILGEENIELQKQLDVLRKQLEKKLEDEASCMSDISSLDLEISNSKTDTARLIKQLLNLPVQFDKRNVQIVIDRIRANYLVLILTNEELQRNITIYKNPDRKDPVPSMSKAENLNTPYYEKKVTDLLRFVLTRKVEGVVFNDPKEHSWVETGFGLNKDRKDCLFCGNTISATRWDDLNSLFSKESDDFIKRIDNLVVELEQKIPRIDLPTKELFYKDLQADYESCRKVVEIQVATEKTTIQDFVAALNLKRAKLFEEITMTTTSTASTLASSVEKMNVVIRKHNDRSKNFDAEKEKAKNLVIDHSVADYMKRFDLLGREIRLGSLQSKLEVVRHEISSIRLEIVRIDKILSNEVKGATTVNQILLLYFGKDDIEIVVTPDKKYQLVRSGIVARNLSEGEKTAIAFSFFLAKLAEKGNRLDRTIVYIDDPISSLDANHLYNTFALIRNRLSAVAQLFISTHNYEFFRLLRDDSFFRKYKENKTGKMCSYYYILRTGKTTSTIQDMPEALERYTSEYHYLFTMLKKYYSGSDESDFFTYSIPNMTRKVLEIYSSFKVPGPKMTLDQRLSKLAKEPQIAIRIYKFVNHLSHSDSIDFGLQFPTGSECKEVLGLVFDLIRQTDDGHFIGMEKLV